MRTLRIVIFYLVPVTRATSWLFQVARSALDSAAASARYYYLVLQHTLRPQAERLRRLSGARREESPLAGNSFELVDAVILKIDSGT